MLIKILRAFITVIGIMIGPGILLLLKTLYEYFSKVDLNAVLASWIPFVMYIIGGIVSGIIFFLLSKKIAGAIERGIKKTEADFSKTSSIALLSGAIGLILGLIVAALFSIVIGLIPVAWVSIPLTVIVYIIFGYLGLSMGVRRRKDLLGFFQTRKSGKGSETKTDASVSPKILDTSVIIDGRIFDICKTGMFEGEILIPEFVLVELQRIADSGDSIKRTRGRRGLDILNRMKKELKVPVRITEIDYEDVAEVDSKLLKLAKELGGKVVTNDYNLNKVAAVQNVSVFNINELANAVKPILMAGEELAVMVVKDGKEQNQGIAYLDDGTMIVVEGARGRMDETLTVIVTSILQTAAGRMIFAKIK